MQRIIYISSVAKGFVNSDLDDILAASRRNNRVDQISGLLVHDTVRFLQALEGPAALVEATYERIARDPRHRAPVILSSKVIAEREFGHWEMACERVDRRISDSTIAELVDHLVASVPDPNTRALFSGFARTDRRPAARTERAA